MAASQIGVATLWEAVFADVGVALLSHLIKYDHVIIKEVMRDCSLHIRYKMTTSAINFTTLITDKVKDLPPEKQQEILDFVEFISNKYHQDKGKESKPKKKRILGLHKGKVWMSDDFNEPLPPEILGKII